MNAERGRCSWVPAAVRSDCRRPRSGIHPITAAIHVRLASSIAIILSVALAACGGSHAPSAREAVVDSAVSIDTLLSRFRSGLERPAGFMGGAVSRDALIRRFVEATERADSAALRDLALTRAEFAWLYYPSLPEAAPPYELDPRLMWFMIETNSGRGLRSLLEERGGRPLGFVDYACAGQRRPGENTVWGPCTIRRLQSPRDTTAEVLFGPVVEHGGRFKLVSFANGL